MINIIKMLRRLGVGFEPRFFILSISTFLLRNVDIRFSQFSKFNFVVHLTSAVSLITL